MSSLLARFRTEYRDGATAGLARVALGLLLFWQALEAGRELITRGYFGDAFHLPFVPAELVPGRRVYALILAARLAASTLAAIGVRARAALFVAGATSLFTLLCDRLHYTDEQYALGCVAVLFAFAPCDRAWLIGGPLPPAARVAPFWAIRLAQLQLTVMYLASGGSKLLDPDWRAGLVLMDRVARTPPLGQLVGARLPLMSGVAKLAIATELFLAIGLWLRRTRVLALFWGVWFHLAIELVSREHLLTGLALTLYVLFATPDVRARKLAFDPSRPKALALARAVTALDWLARFEVRPWAPDGKRGHAIVVTRRDGTRATGIRALAMIARCVPLLFPLWGPLALVASFTKGGETSARV